jgi:hypothetical protein
LAAVGILFGLAGSQFANESPRDHRTVETVQAGDR